MPSDTGFYRLLASCLLIAIAAPALADGFKISGPKPAPSIKFQDDNGNVRPIAPQTAKLTAVHFWATWCAPCVAELPEVDATQWAYGDKAFKVVPLSLDGAGKMDKVKQFYNEHKIAHLPPYLDANMSSFKAAELHGLPATIFIDKDGNEVARAEGPLNWKDDKVVEFIESRLK